MSAVRTNHNLKKVQQDFELALQNLSNVLKEIRPKANILNTKLGKIKKDLDWQISIGLEEGIRKTIDWARLNPWWYEERN